MSIPGSLTPLFSTGSSAAAGYQVERSLRFNSADSAYLSQGTSRTPAANTSITFSFWLKLSSLSTDQQIIWSNPAAGFLYIAYWGSYQNGALWVGNDASGLDVNAAKSNGVLRDPSAWYHILYSRAHGSNGILYINGVQQTTQAINTANVDFFADSTRSIGRRSDSNSRYVSLYLADFHCIDGQALTPSSFTEVSATTGQLIPKTYTGTYTGNSFWLKFNDNSAATATTLGKDSFLLGNNWTPNNLSVTAGISLPGVLFDGAGDYLTIADSADFDLSNLSFTIECFVKPSSSITAEIMGQRQGGNEGAFSLYQTGSQVLLYVGNSGWNIVAGALIANLNLNDWTHLAVVRDGSNFKCYGNGTLMSTTVSSATIQNSTFPLSIGANQASAYFNGAISNVRIVKGTAVYTSNFTPPTSSLSNITNTVLLCCQSNSSTTAYTVSPGAITANGNVSASQISDYNRNDSLVDTPTSIAATDTGVGGEVRGNYSTFNPLSGSASYTYSNGNLDLSFDTVNDSHAITTITVTSGVWYCEGVMTARGSSSGAGFCVLDGAKQWNSANSSASGRVEYRETGEIIFNGSVVTTVASYTTNDVIGIWIDATNNEVKFYKNNSLQRTQSSLAFGSYMPGYYANGGANRTSSATINTGQRAFSYSAPSSGKALCDTNLGAPLIAKPNTLMDVALWTGNGSTQTISGLGFSPDFVWVKVRSNAGAHGLFDTVRGAGYKLVSNVTNAEAYNGIGSGGDLIAFNSDGFNLGDNTAGSAASTNLLNYTYVAWAWDAGTSTVSNTAGSITSQVRANASAGFSVVTWTGTGSNATVGHGLGVAPQLLIIKRRSGANDWIVGHTSLGGWANILYLNLTNATDTASTIFQSTAPTSTLFSLGTSTYVNGSSETYVAYCFAPVSGYSSFGSYTGNGSADGPFVFCNFRPKYVLLKCSSAGDSAKDWFVHDGVRDTYNLAQKSLNPNRNIAELDNASYGIDLLSNGFKIRTTSTGWNGSAETYIYAAFAENPFQYSRAR